MSVLSGAPTHNRITRRFAILSSHRVAYGGRLGESVLGLLSRLRMIPYSRSTVEGFFPVTPDEERSERRRQLLSMGLGLAGFVGAIAIIAGRALEGRLPDSMSDSRVVELIIAVTVDMVLMGAAMLVRPRVRIRVSSKNALKGRARILAHPDFVKALNHDQRGLVRDASKRLSQALPVVQDMAPQESAPAPFAAAEGSTDPDLPIEPDRAVAPPPVEPPVAGAPTSPATPPPAPTEPPPLTARPEWGQPSAN